MEKEENLNQENTSTENSNKEIETDKQSDEKQEDVFNGHFNHVVGVIGLGKK